MNEKPKMHGVPQSGWLEVSMQCREVLEDGTTCPDCEGKGKKAVPVSISELTRHIEKHIRDNFDRDVRRG